MNTQINKLWLTCGLVFSAILLVVVISFFVTSNTVSRELDIRIDEYASITEDLIDDQFRNSEDILWDGAGYLNTNTQTVTNEVWGDFIEQSGVIDRYPGILGIGYSDVNDRSEIDSLEQTYDIDVYPDTSNQTISPVLFLYPTTEANNKVLGYDMYSSDVRSTAMYRARDNNDVYLTKPTKLVQTSDLEGSEGLGFIMYVPRYTKGQDVSTIEQRREHIEGYVYSVLRADEFFTEALSSQNEDKVYYQIFSGDNLLYEEPGTSEKIDENYQQRTISFSFRGINFSILYVFSESDVLPSSIRSQPISVLLIGITGASLATFLTWLLLSNRNKELMLEKERDINDAKDNLLSIASHQLRTPATGVKQYIGMVLNGMAGDISATQKRFLEKAYESNERQLKIINDVLYLARLESGRIVLSKSKIKMRTIVQSLVEEMHEIIEENNHKIKVTAPKTPVYIWADEHMVRMILENLLSNAVKYTPEGGKIHVTLKKAQGGINVFVKDSGVGIKEEEKEEIFKQFSRVTNSLSKSVSGSGIGLYLVKNLVTLHDGEIDVESDGKKGSTFILYLPTNKPSENEKL